ncbi:MAG: AAA family ATPase [Candidatus Glassbacteria bacterium]|nr:AAA family ATPase [Candidatus Glassbacteria bacterium]
MNISHVKLKNWRNFRTVDVELGRRVFIIGPNASGKSNFLDVFRFLGEIAKPGGGLQKAVSDRGGLSKIRCFGARKEPQVEIEVHLKESFDGDIVWRYAIGMTQETSGHRNTILKYEKVWKNNQLILDRPDKEDKEDDLRLTETHLEQITANYSFRKISEFFKSICYMHIIPQLLRHPELFKGPVVEEDPFGRKFLEKVARTPEKYRKSRLKKIEEALRLTTPQLKGLGYSKDLNGIPHLEAIYEHWRPKAGKQNEEQFSDGTLRLVGFLWSLLEGDSLLLLEEPEIHLHAGIVKKLPSLIWRIQNKKRRQVIISTHSTDLLSDEQIGGEEALLLTPDTEGTRVELASKIEEVRDLLEKGLSLAEISIPRTEPKQIIQLDLFNG